MDSLFLLPFYLLIGLSLTNLAIDALIKNKFVSYIFSLISLVIVGIVVVNTGFITKTVGLFTFSPLSAIFDLAMILGGIVTILSSYKYNFGYGEEKSEFYSVILFSTLGIMFAVHSANLLILFVGIEIVSICFYILASFNRKNLLSVEAGVKYFLLGAFSTGFLLMGMAYLFGISNSLFISDIILPDILSANITYTILGFGMLLVGISFKIAIIPFHQWAPDVYTGAPTPIAGYLSTAGKALTIGTIIAIFNTLDIQVVSNERLLSFFAKYKLIIGLLASTTMIVGNLLAFNQKSLKRMLAYSSISHAGYIFIGFALLNKSGYNAMAFYTITYIFMQLGAFILLSSINSNKGYETERDDLVGLYKKSPFLSAMFAVFLLALAGIPPFSGFIGKYLLFTAAIQHDMLWLAIVGIISSVISIYYYLSPLIYIYFKPSNDNIEIRNNYSILAICITAILTFGLGLFPFIITNMMK